jgi:SAM-dependent methyltransferase
MQAIENSYLAARLNEHGIREPILEIGAGWQPDFHQKPFRERGATRFFTQEVAVYDNNPADFVGDLSKGTEIPEAFAGTVLLFNVLEHVPKPWLAIAEVARIVRQDGFLIGSIPFRAAIHRWPGDYFSAKPDGLAVLLRKFKILHFALDGDPALPANLLFTAVKDASKEDWLSFNADAVLHPELIIGNDYLTHNRFKRFIVDCFRRFGCTLELYTAPKRREVHLRELGYIDFTVRKYDSNDRPSEPRRGSDWGPER